MKAKKIISVLLSVVLLLGTFPGVLSFASEGDNGVVDFSPADQQNETDRTIRFNSSGKLKILHITDTHLGHNSDLEKSIWVISQACDAENPDIVLLTGDNVSNSDNAEDTKKLINALMNVFDLRNIPVAVTFGNHDSEGGAMTRKELMDYYNTFSCSVSVDNSEAFGDHCATYNVPVLGSQEDKVKFNLWVFDSGDYDQEGRYDCVQPEQIEWYKKTSDALKDENNGENVNSLAFQHIIVPEVYDALKKVKFWQPFAVEHIYNSDEYYVFNPDGVNFGILNEMPCPGYYNHGQFDAMAEKGDVLAMFTGHDHTNAFGVRHKGVDIYTSLSTRYRGDCFSTQYGYRIIEVDENDTSVYKAKTVRWYDMIDFAFAKNEKENGSEFSYDLALDIAFKGLLQKIGLAIYHFLSETFLFRQITYPELN